MEGNGGSILPLLALGSFISTPATFGPTLTLPALCWPRACRLATGRKNSSYFLPGLCAYRIECSNPGQLCHRHNNVRKRCFAPPSNSHPVSPAELSWIKLAPATPPCANASTRCSPRTTPRIHSSNPKRRSPAVSRSKRLNWKCPPRNRPTKPWARRSGATSCWRSSAKAVAAWSTWWNRSSRCVAGWRLRSSSWAWTPSRWSPASRPSGRRWR